MKINHPNSSSFQKWILAARPKTLPAAAAPVILGSILAFKEGIFNFLPAFCTLVISLLLQIGANFANDLFDFQKGSDNSHRLGPTRVTQSGILTPKQMSIGIILVFAFSSLLGIYLISIGGWIIAGIGFAAILAALLYSGGPFPYGYHALGDLFVFLFFGLAAVGGSYYIQTNSYSFPAFLASCSIGLLITNILVVNNRRDIESDRSSKKITLAVLLGEKGSQIEYMICFLIAYSIPVILSCLFLSYLGSMLTWVSLPFAIKLVIDFSRSKGREFNLILARTATLSVWFAILFSIGILII